MLLYILRRITVLIPVALTVMFITFMISYYGPIDPVRVMLGEDWADEERYQDMRHALGLDRPVWVQFGEYMARLARGDMGHSLSGGPPISEMIASRLKVSAGLGLWALLILAAVGVPLGVLAAVRQNTILDYTAVTTSAVLSAIPPFVLGPMMLIVFVAKLHWFQTVGGWDGMFSKSAILPSVLLAAGPMVRVIRQTRAGIIEVLTQDFVRTARAKGLPERLVITRHMLRSSMTPVLTSLGLILITMLLNATFVESIFVVPGIGRLAASVISSGDYPVMLAVILVESLIIMGANLLTDIMYGVLDPRVQY